MNKLVEKMFAALVISMSFACFAAESELPRMWEVTGSGAKFYILGISHNGLDVEYDEYLETKIVPAFLSSDVMAFENAEIFPSTAPACPNAWPDSDENTALMNLARERVKTLVKIFLSNTAPADGKGVDLKIAYENIAEQMANSYSEYGLISAINSFENSMPSGSNKFPSLGRGQVTNYLLQKKRNMATESVDTPQEFIAAYCKTNGYRPAYFRKLISDQRFENRKITATDVAEANRDFSESARNEKMTGVFSTKNVEEESAMVCDRTRNWLPKILENTKKGVYFYALGIVHLMPGTGRSEHCSGLLSDLKGKGFSVTKIQ